MLLDGIFQRCRSAVVKEEPLPALRSGGEPQTPEWCRAPLGGFGPTLRVSIIEFRPHVVQQEITVGVEVDA
jgi:hypothetical protein